MKPHKFEGQTVSDRKWSTGDWNPRECVNCGKSSGHPVHQKKFRAKPLKYQLYIENRKK